MISAAAVVAAAVMVRMMCKILKQSPGRAIGMFVLITEIAMEIANHCQPSARRCPNPRFPCPWPNSATPSLQFNMDSQYIPWTESILEFLASAAYTYVSCTATVASGSALQGAQASGYMLLAVLYLTFQLTGGHVYVYPLPTSPLPPLAPNFFLFKLPPLFFASSKTILFVWCMV